MMDARCIDLIGITLIVLRVAQFPCLLFREIGAAVHLVTDISII